MYSLLVIDRQRPVGRIEFGAAFAEESTLLKLPILIKKKRKKPATYWKSKLEKGGYIADIDIAPLLSACVSETSRNGCA